VKPGLTGLWQVSGRSELSYDARVALDCEYVERWSLGKDVMILLKTFDSVVNQDGAF
jgi:lipopolysaccharide/colanic/teichoic acid biosynthesis glycosyltransferase